MNLGSHTVTLLRAAETENEYGNTERDWVNATRTAVSGCSVQPVQGDEATVGRDTIVSRWRLFAPADADIIATDRVEYDGAVYDVDGEVHGHTPVRVRLLPNALRVLAGPSFVDT